VRSPNGPTCHLHRARALAFGADRPAEAVEAINVAIRLAPDDSAHLLRAAALLLALGELDSAEACLKQATARGGLSNQRDDPGLACLSGMLAAARSEHASAAELLEVAVEGQPQNPDYAADLARLYVKLGQRDRARSVASKALQDGPGNEALSRLAAMARAEKRTDAWLAAATSALDGAPAGLRCPEYDDGELVWEAVEPIAAGGDRYRLYCPACGAEVVVDVDATD